MTAVCYGYFVVLPSEIYSMHSRKIRRPKGSHKLNMSEDNEEETPLGVRAPIVGYEVVDRREKFTVYKVNVRNRSQSWFVFRRYTDFVRLNGKLQIAFPSFHFTLPAKRWFKNNFDPDFIEERARGLQFFINNIMQHSIISKSHIVKEFLCLDDPPGPFDSLEESRAYCQQLEDEVEDMKERMSEMQSELNATKSQLAQARVQQEALVQSLQEERASNTLKKDAASDSGTFKSLSNSEGTGDDTPWNENLNESIKKVKPLARRQILTSTPEKNTELKSYAFDGNLPALEKEYDGDQENDKNKFFDDIDKTLGNFESNEKETEQVNEPSDSPRLEEFASANSDTDDELSEINAASSGNNKSRQSSKRDSGIIADNGLSPVTA